MMEHPDGPYKDERPDLASVPLIPGRNAGSDSDWDRGYTRGYDRGYHRGHRDAGKKHMIACGWCEASDKEIQQLVDKHFADGHVHMDGTCPKDA